MFQLNIYLVTCYPQMDRCDDRMRIDSDLDDNVSIFLRTASEEFLGLWNMSDFLDDVYF